MVDVMGIGGKLGWQKPIVILAASGVLAAMSLAAGGAEARGRVFLGFNFGAPVYGYGPPAYYPPPAYYYSPYYYYPPAVTYAPVAPGVPPVASATPAPGAVSQETCREYQSSTVIDGQTQTVTGTACLQPDGSWRIVR